MLSLLHAYSLSTQSIAVVNVSMLVTRAYSTRVLIIIVFSTYLFACSHNLLKKTSYRAPGHAKSTLSILEGIDDHYFGHMTGRTTYAPHPKPLGLNNRGPRHALN
jgi:hypothetical protein